MNLHRLPAGDIIPGDHVVRPGDGVGIDVKSVSSDGQFSIISGKLDSSGKLFDLRLPSHWHLSVSLARL